MPRRRNPPTQFSTSADPSEARTQVSACDTLSHTSEVLRVHVPFEAVGKLHSSMHYTSMTKPLPIDPQAALARVRELMAKAVPDARCELRDYSFRIGCGSMDPWGNIQDVQFMIRGETEEGVAHSAYVLTTKLRTGGSTAG